MKKVIIGLITIALALVAGFYYGYPNVCPENDNIGSTNVGNEYSSILLSGSLATTTTAISSIGGILGSIIVTEDQALAIDVYDATSTEAISNPLSEKIAIMEASQSEGTYTFDTYLKYGLVLDTTDWTAFAGTWTITYR